MTLIGFFNNKFIVLIFLLAYAQLAAENTAQLQNDLRHTNQLQKRIQQ